MTTSYPGLKMEFTSTEFRRSNRVSTPTISLPEVTPLIRRTDFYRYEGLDLTYYKQIMEAHVYNVFVDFVGKLDVEMFEDDFEVYYPEE